MTKQPEIALPSKPCEKCKNGFINIKTMKCGHCNGTGISYYAITESQVREIVEAFKNLQWDLENDQHNYNIIDKALAILVKRS